MGKTPADSPTFLFVMIPNEVRTTKPAKLAEATIADLTPDSRNANKGTERGAGMLEKSLRKHGAGRSILIDKNGKVIAGNKTLESAAGIGLEDVIVVESDGTRLVAVKRTDIDLDTPQGRELAIADNRTGEVSLEWDADELAALSTEIDLSDLFSDTELADMFATVESKQSITEGEARQTLSERFLIPPFSVLDARQGYWQDRKRAWIALGIESELGRGAASPGGSPRPAATLHDGHTVRGDGTGKPLKNGLLGFSEQARTHYKNNPGDQPTERHLGGLNVHCPTTYPLRSSTTSSDKAMQYAGGFEDASPGTSGTSIFDPVLCEAIYTWFTPKAGAVLDPFAGGSVRGIVAAQLGRNYTGIDLRAEQIAANEAQAQAIESERQPRWIVGDSRELPSLADGEYDFIFSCPPYFDLEVYSDHPGDLSACSGYEAFLKDYRQIVADACGKLKADRFACFVVGDIRDKDGNYRNFVSDTIAAFRDAGLQLYNEAILVTAVGSLPIRVSAQFPVGRKLGKTHQNVLVFLKGDAKKAVKACGTVKVYEMQADELAD